MAVDKVRGNSRALISTIRRHVLVSFLTVLLIPAFGAGVALYQLGKSPHVDLHSLQPSQIQILVSDPGDTVHLSIFAMGHNVPFAPHTPYDAFVNVSVSAPKGKSASSVHWILLTPHRIPGFLVRSYLSQGHGGEVDSYLTNHTGDIGGVYLDNGPVVTTSSGFVAITMPEVIESVGTSAPQVELDQRDPTKGDSDTESSLEIIDDRRGEAAQSVIFPSSSGKFRSIPFAGSPTPFYAPRSLTTAEMLTYSLETYQVLTQYPPPQSISSSDIRWSGAGDLAPIITATDPELEDKRSRYIFLDGVALAMFASVLIALAQEINNDFKEHRTTPPRRHHRSAAQEARHQRGRLR